jgi:hypothetical protein
MSAAAILAVQVVIPKAYALSPYGNGTPSKPYLVTTCAQLQEIESHLSSSFKLMRTIDCTGFTFTAIGQSTFANFTGQLDGNNYSIRHVNTARGLFFSLNNATIKNLKLTLGTITTGPAGVGSLAAWADNSTIENVYSDMTVTGSGGVNVGGLVGVSTAPLTISKSAYYGNLTANSSGAGGLVGNLSSSGTVISDSYVRGSITASSSVAGGLVGTANANSVTIRRSYSAAVLNLTNTTGTGGFVGGNGTQTVAEDSFAANTVAVTGTATPLGGIFGGDGTATNTFFSSNFAGTTDCAGSGNAVVGCTGVPVDPSDFTNGAYQSAADGWDFFDTWVAQDSDFPDLLTNKYLIKALGTGDMNADGIQDGLQAKVVSAAYWANFEDVTFVVPSGGGCVTDDGRYNDTDYYKTDPDYSLQTPTMWSFVMYCADGATVPVTAIFDKEYDVSKSVLRHFNITTLAYTNVPDVVYSTITVGGVVKTTATYNVTDGGPLDDDGTVNGVINDPVGLKVAVPLGGSATVGPPNTGAEPMGTSRILDKSLGIMLLLLGADAVFMRKFLLKEKV